jgi:hypothetical protein
MQKGEVKWRRMPAASFAPGGLILDAPNSYVTGEEEKYGANGYMTLEFNGDKLNEIVRAPDGTSLYERELS